MSGTNNIVYPLRRSKRVQETRHRKCGCQNNECGEKNFTYGTGAYTSDGYEIPFEILGVVRAIGGYITSQPADTDLSLREMVVNSGVVSEDNIY